MKKIILMLFVGLVFSSYSQAAESLTFKWDYDPVAAAKLTGFKLWRDGTILEKDLVNPTARSITILRQTDGKPYVYFLTAYATDENGGESGASSTALDIPKITRVKSVGTVTIEITGGTTP